MNKLQNEKKALLSFHTFSKLPRLKLSSFQLVFTSGTRWFRSALYIVYSAPPMSPKRASANFCILFGVYTP